MNKKKIIFLSSCVRGGGAGWSLYYLIKYLDRKKYEPVVIVPEPGIYEQMYKEIKVRMLKAPHLPERSAQQHFHRINLFTKFFGTCLNTIGIIRTIVWVKKFAEEEDADLIYANNMLVKSIGAFAGKLAKIPCILHIRNLHETTMEAMLYGRIARLSSVKVLISNSTASAVPLQKYAGEKIRIVHNGVDPGEYTGIKPGQLRKETSAGKKKIIGYTGNIIPRKGIDVLIKASAEILKKNKNTLLIIVGRVPIGSSTNHQEKYEKLAEELGIRDRVIFAGFRKDIRPSLRDMDILVLPSRQEPFGRSIIEAMALGIPVVASEVGGIPEIITDNKDGCLTPVEDTVTLSNTLKKLLKSKATRDRIGKNARKTIENKFNIKKLSLDIQKIIEELLNTNNR